MKFPNRTRFLKSVIVVFLCWMAAHIAYIVYDGLRDEGKTADVAVVLGTTVNEDGTLSDRLQKRLECAVELYSHHRVKTLFVSGGFGKEGYFEGTKMREFLVLRGVPPDCIIVDNAGDNTEATVRNAMATKARVPFQSVIVVSQYFHVTRTKMYFRQYGFTNISSVAPRYFEWRDLYSLPREFFAYYV